MKTCKYCGNNLTELKDNKYFCNFCELEFLKSETEEDGSRPKQSVFELPIIEDPKELTQRSTTDLLNEKTVTLYYLLRSARKLKDEFYKSENFEMTALMHKKAMVIENILLEKEGKYPKRITNSLLKQKRQSIQEFEEKNSMKIRQIYGWEKN